ALWGELQANAERPASTSRIGPLGGVPNQSGEGGCGLEPASSTTPLRGAPGVASDGSADEPLALSQLEAGRCDCHRPAIRAVERVGRDHDPGPCQEVESGVELGSTPVDASGQATDEYRAIRPAVRLADDRVQELVAPGE